MQPRWWLCLAARSTGSTGDRTVKCSRPFLMQPSKKGKIDTIDLCDAVWSVEWNEMNDEKCAHRRRSASKLGVKKFESNLPVKTWATLHTGIVLGLSKLCICLGGLLCLVTLAKWELVELVHICMCVCVWGGRSCPLSTFPPGVVGAHLWHTPCPGSLPGLHAFILPSSCPHSPLFSFPSFCVSLLFCGSWCGLYVHRFFYFVLFQNSCLVHSCSVRPFMLRYVFCLPFLSASPAPVHLQPEHLCLIRCR